MNKMYDLADFSHEINNSLTLIYSQLEYIEKTNDVLQKNQTWHHMKEDFSSLFDWIHESLSSSSVTSSSMEPLNMTNLLEEVRSSWSFRLAREQIGFFLQTDFQEPYYIYAPKPQLLQILHNLVSNGVKAIERKKETGKSPNITIHLSKEQGHVVLNLSDTGIGMTKEQQSRAFYRGVSFSPNGNGIGLSVVNEIAKDLHIKIHMDSAINQGTTFTLIFPCEEHAKPTPV